MKSPTKQVLVLFNWRSSWLFGPGSAAFLLAILFLLMASCTREDSNINPDEWYPLVELSSPTLVLDRTQIIGPPEMSEYAVSIPDSARMAFNYDEVELPSAMDIVERYFVDFDYTFELDGPLTIDIDSLVGLPEGITAVSYFDFDVIVECSAELEMSYNFFIPPVTSEGTQFVNFEAGEPTCAGLEITHPDGISLHFNPEVVPMTVRLYLKPGTLVDVRAVCGTENYPFAQLYSPAELIFDPTPKRMRSEIARYSGQDFAWVPSAQSENLYDFVFIDSADDDVLSIGAYQMNACFQVLTPDLIFSSSEEGSFVLPSYLDESNSRLNGLTSSSPFREKVFEDLRRMQIGVGENANYPSMRVSWTNTLPEDLPLTAQYFLPHASLGEIDLCPPFEISGLTGVDTIPLTSDFVEQYEALLGDGQNDLSEQVMICVRIADSTLYDVTDVEGLLRIEQSLLPF